MAVNIKFLIILSLFLSSSYSDDQNDSVNYEKKQLNYIKKQLNDSKKAFDNKINICDKKEDKIISLNNDFLKNYTKEDVYNSISILNYTNYHTCINIEYQKYLRNIGMLFSLEKAYSLNTEETLSMLYDVSIFEASNASEFLSQEKNIPPELKEYLHENIGDKPFNLIQTIKPYIDYINK